MGSWRSGLARSRRLRGLGFDPSLRLQPALWGALATRCEKGLVWASAQDTLGSTKKKIYINILDINHT